MPLLLRPTIVRFSQMELRNGTYRIRNYRTKNHASLLYEHGDIVACDGYHRAGEKWKVTKRNERDRYEIRNLDKPEYCASCHPTPGQHAYLRGLRQSQLWTIRDDSLGRSIDEETKTYTIFADGSRGGYWKFETEEPHAQAILTQNSPNDWSLWVFEPVEENALDTFGQPCTHHQHPRSPNSNGKAIQVTDSETENRPSRVNNTREEDLEKYFDKIPRVHGAAYNSSQRDFRTGCLSGTREYPLSAVHKWVQSPTPPLFWLNGLAGTGKTTIAHSVAEYYDERKQLGASFFFSRDQQDRRATRQVISTIAYQLGKAYPEVREHIAASIKNQNPLHSNSRTQFRQLIVEPLSTLPRQNSQPTVIVIDALDESDDHSAAANIVELLATELRHTHLPLKFFVTSRPEKDLRSKFLSDSVSSGTRTLILHDIDLGIVQKDIKIFLQARLTEVAARHRDEIPQKPSKWPTAAEIDALTERAGGLFIFASTVVGFLDESSFLAPERLSSILNEDVTASSSNLNPYANLDKLYYQILEFMLHARPHPIEDTADMFRRVVGTIFFLRKPASCEDLSGLLNTNVKGALMHLHSVVKIPNEDDDNRTIEIFHKSFHDYLTDRARCTDHRLFIDPPAQHCIIAESCLNVITNSLETFLSTTIYIRNPPHLNQIPEFLCYACSEWTEHALVCLHDKKLLDLAQSFFSTTSINWIMLLSISLQHLGASLSNADGGCLVNYQADGAIRSFTFASVLAVALPPADSRSYFECGFADILTPFSMTSRSQINEYYTWKGVGLEWLENASVRASPGSPAQSAYYHILGCIRFQLHEFEQSVEWFQKALPVGALDHGHSFEVLRDMVAARCRGAQKHRDFLDYKWRLPLQDVESSIRSLQRDGGCRADILFTLGNLYWMRFQLVDNTFISEDIDISIQYLQNAANAAPPNSLRCESLLNLVSSLLMRYDFIGSHADIDRAEECLLAAAELQPHEAYRAGFYLQRDLGYAMYKHYKLHGQCGDIKKSISHLMEAMSGVECNDGLVGIYLDEACDALEELGQNDPEACINIWRCCHDPHDANHVSILNKMIAGHSYRFWEWARISSSGHTYTPLVQFIPPPYAFELVVGENESVVRIRLGWMEEGRDEIWRIAK